ncbi:hypothetical protein AB1Y20_006186 [Prymnesium parvum]|uniref:Phospholipase B-like n=1 Tax=Prymnesium parvum TaxID=97485 RepID=A0AB34J431_PRYPA
MWAKKVALSEREAEELREQWRPSTTGDAGWPLVNKQGVVALFEPMLFQRAFSSQWTGAELDKVGAVMQMWDGGDGQVDHVRESQLRYYIKEQPPAWGARKHKD